MLFNIVWSKLRNLRCHIALHLLCKTLILKGLSPFLTKLVQRLSEILFHLFVSSKLLTDSVNPVTHLTFHHIVIYGKRVQTGLHQEKFRHHHLLKNLTDERPSDL